MSEKQRLTHPLATVPSKQPDKDFLWVQISELPYFRAMLRAVEAEFYQHIDLPGPTLDVGCGDGHFAVRTFDRKLEVGLDPWTGPLREANRRNFYKITVQADAGKIPYPDNYFSSGLSNSVLEHIPHIDQVLKDTARVLKPGAPFVFCVPNPRYFSELSISNFFDQVGLKGLGTSYREWFRRISRVQHADTPAVWQGRLERAGMRLEKHWDYFSPQAMRTLEWGHYFGLPSLICRKLTGRWVIAPAHWNLALVDKMVRPLAQPVADPLGTFTFFIARKI